jgi:hypothetical protein
MHNHTQEKVSCFYINIILTLAQNSATTLDNTLKMKKNKSKDKSKSKPKSQPRKQSGRVGTKVVPQSPGKVGKDVKIQKQKLKPTRVKRSRPKPKTSRKPSRSKTVKPNQEKEEEMPEELQWIKEDPHELLLSRFVETPKGTKLGESIGIDGKRLILKNKLNFYSIPLKTIKEKDQILILRKKVDWDEASKLGETWRKNTLDYIKPAPKPAVKPRPRVKSKTKRKAKPNSKAKTKTAKKGRSVKARK